MIRIDPAAARRLASPCILFLAASLAAACAATSSGGGAPPAPKTSPFLPLGTEPTTNEDVLVITCAGLDTILGDPRDAGLLRALDLLDERIAELPHDFKSDPPPPGVLELLQLLGAPHHLRIAVDATAKTGGGPPLRAELRFATGDPAGAAAHQQTIDGLLANAGPLQVQPSADHPGLEEIALPWFASALFGKPADSGDFVLAYGGIDEGGLGLGSLDLPAGVEPTLAFKLDLAPVQGLIQGILASGNAEAREAAEMLDAFGILGEHPLWLSAACGRRGDRGFASMRFKNWAKSELGRGSVSGPPLTEGDYRRVPADASFATLSRFDPDGIPDLIRSMSQGGQDPFVLVQSLIGIDLDAELFAHLGHASGLYMSDTTGGGGILSGVAFWSLRNQEGMRTTVEKIATMLNGIAAAEAEGRVRITARDWEGASMHTMTFPGVPVPFEPCLALADDTLFLSLTPQAAMAAVRQARGAGPALLDDPAVRSLLPRAPETLQAMTFVDSARALRDGYSAAALVASAISNAVRSPGAPDRDPGWILPLFNELAASAHAGLSVSFLDADDLVTLSVNDGSAFANIASLCGGPLSPAIAVGILSGIAVPAIVQRQEAAQRAQRQALLQHEQARAEAEALRQQLEHGHDDDEHDHDGHDDDDDDHDDDGHDEARSRA